MNKMIIQKIAVTSPPPPQLKCTLKSYKTYTGTHDGENSRIGVIH